MEILTVMPCRDCDRIYSPPPVFWQIMSLSIVMDVSFYFVHNSQMVKYPDRETLTLPFTRLNGINAIE
jgi:hypothetical protein